MSLVGLFILLFESRGDCNVKLINAHNMQHPSQSQLKPPEVLCELDRKFFPCTST